MEGLVLCGISGGGGLGSLVCAEELHRGEVHVVTRVAGGADVVEAPAVDYSFPVGSLGQIHQQVVPFPIRFQGHALIARLGRARNRARAEVEVHAIAVVVGAGAVEEDHVLVFVGIQHDVVILQEPTRVEEGEGIVVILPHLHAENVSQHRVGKPLQIGVIELAKVCFHQIRAEVNAGSHAVGGVAVADELQLGDADLAVQVSREPHLTHFVARPQVNDNLGAVGVNGGIGQTVGDIVSLVALAVAVRAGRFQAQNGGFACGGGVSNLIGDLQFLKATQIEVSQPHAAVGRQDQSLLGNRGAAEQGVVTLPHDTRDADGMGGGGNDIGLTVAEVQQGGQITGDPHAIQRADVHVVASLGEIGRGCDGEGKACGGMARHVGDACGGQVGAGRGLCIGHGGPFSVSAAHGDPQVLVSRNTLGGGQPALHLKGLSQIQLHIAEHRDAGIAMTFRMELFKGVLIRHASAVVGSRPCGHGYGESAQKHR